MCPNPPRVLRWRFSRLTLPYGLLRLSRTSLETDLPGLMSGVTTLLLLDEIWEVQEEERRKPCDVTEDLLLVDTRLPCVGKTLFEEKA